MPAYSTDLSFARSQNILGGNTGSLIYQLGSTSTAFIGIGSTGTVLTSNGTTATWAAPGVSAPDYLITTFGFI